MGGEARRIGQARSRRGGGLGRREVGMGATSVGSARRRARTVRGRRHLWVIWRGVMSPRSVVAKLRARD